MLSTFLLLEEIFLSPEEVGVIIGELSAIGESEKEGILICFEGESVVFFDGVVLGFLQAFSHFPSHIFF